MWVGSRKPRRLPADSMLLRGKGGSRSNGERFEPGMFLRRRRDILGDFRQISRYDIDILVIRFRQISKKILCFRD